MNKILFFIFLLIISCEEQWTDSESLDFLNRCKQERPKNIIVDSNSYDDFCLCLSKKSQKLKIPYQDFLNTNLPQSDLDTIVSSCIDE
tara:strand:+ start:36 stop:299 length:264 start_codon:yes stop_codon:yes gene_type:complete